MDALDFQHHAENLVAALGNPPQPGPNQVGQRRAISASYYALFHMLAGAGAQLVAPTDAVLRNQVARAFSHTVTRKVCDACERSPKQPFPQALSHLNRGTADLRLVNVAATFALLQDARHLADYDMLAVFVLVDTVELIEAARSALDDFQAIRPDPDTQVFLTALLLSHKWTRRG